MDYVKAKHIITKGPGDSWFGGDYNMNIVTAGVTVIILRILIR